MYNGLSRLTEALASVNTYEDNRKTLRIESR